jgi:hypothetical protein
VSAKFLRFLPKLIILVLLLILILLLVLHRYPHSQPGVFENLALAGSLAESNGALRGFASLMGKHPERLVVRIP